MAGRLRYFLSEWKLITTDPKILDMVQHCHLEFIELPSQHYNLPPIRFNTRETKIISQASVGKPESENATVFLAKRGVLVPDIPCIDRGNWGRENDIAHS